MTGYKKIIGESIQKSSFSRNIFLDYSPDSQVDTPSRIYSFGDPEILINESPKTR